jgi:hypothetical protein
MMSSFRLEAGFAGALYRLLPRRRPGNFAAGWNLHGIQARCAMRGYKPGYGRR